MWHGSLRNAILRCGRQFGGLGLRPSRRRGLSIGIPEQLEVRRVLDASTGTILNVPILDPADFITPTPTPLIQIVVPPAPPPVGIPPLPAPLLTIPVDSGNPWLPVPSINDYLNPVQAVVVPPAESSFPEFEFEASGGAIPGPLEIEYLLVVPVIVIIF